jgi:hypothetical protein
MITYIFVQTRCQKFHVTQSSGFLRWIETVKSKIVLNLSWRNKTVTIDAKQQRRCYNDSDLPFFFPPPNTLALNLTTSTSTTGSMGRPRSIQINNFDHSLHVLPTHHS